MPDAPSAAQPPGAESGDTDRRLLRLDPADNVLTAITPIPAVCQLLIEGNSVTSETAIPLGHKVAARRIPAGEKVIKYGAPIGAATCNIVPGDHVHLHNVRSDYLPTHLRGDGPRHVAASQAQTERLADR